MLRKNSAILFLILVTLVLIMIAYLVTEQLIDRLHDAQTGMPHS